MSYWSLKHGCIPVEISDEEAFGKVGNGTVFRSKVEALLASYNKQEADILDARRKLDRAKSFRGLVKQEMEKENNTNKEKKDGE